MDWRNYITVMTPSASSGNIVFNLITYDAAVNISLTLTASTLARDDEITTATKIQQQLTVQLAQASANYSGQPVFSNFPPNATFYLGMTDNSVSVWSQATFRLTQVSNNTGATILIAPSPTYVTLAEAKSFAPLLGSDFTDVNEVALTDTQIIYVLQFASDQISSIINTSLTISCYLHEYIGNMEGSTLLRKGPILSYDPPYILPPVLVTTGLYYFYSYPQSFQVNRKLKILNYRFTSNLINNGDPFDMNNEVKMTYRAGLMNIPRIIKEKTLLVTTLLLNDQNVRSFAGGSFKVEFRLPAEVLAAISSELNSYKNA